MYFTTLKTENLTTVLSDFQEASSILQAAIKKHFNAYKTDENLTRAIAELENYIEGLENEIEELENDI